ncbi:hypothetical protein ISCGN_017173 [Ixodes scapularis]
MTFKEQRLPRCKAGASLIKYKPVFSYDSKFFLVPSGRSVKVFSCSSGECVRTFSKHAAEVIAVVRNPENHVQVLSCSEDGVIIKWDPSDGSVLKKYKVTAPASSGGNRDVLAGFYAPPSGSAWFCLRGTPGAGWCRLETCPAGDDEEPRVLVDKVSLGGASPVAFGGPSCGLYAAIHKARLFIGDCTAPASPLKKFWSKGKQNGVHFTCVTCHPTMSTLATGDSLGCITIWQGLEEGAPARSVYHWHTLPVADLVFSSTGGRNLFFGLQTLRRVQCPVGCTWLYAGQSPKGDGHREVATARLIEVSLWGNRCDLSLSGGAASNPSGGALQETQSLRAKILCNQLTRLWAHLGRMRNRASGGIPTQLHLVMDNAGYEMVTDLCLLDYLQECGFISRACLHVKAMPWYVSDVMRRDLYKTLRQLRDLNHEPTSALAQRCLSRLESGAWAASEDPFWTLPHDYARMAALAPELYRSLQEADLVLFKGDLNYRKLVGDLRWEPSTPFEVALRGFLPTFLCALRTIKADTVAGVDADLAREVAHRSPDWMVTGEYALVQCAGRTLWSRDSEP